MRTTVDLPPVLHRRAKEYAGRHGLSLSAALVELTAAGLNELGDPPRITKDPLTGFPVLSLGLDHVVTSEEVADLLDDE